MMLHGMQIKPEQFHVTVGLWQQYFSCAHTLYTINWEIFANFSFKLWQHCEIDSRTSILY